MLAAIYVLWMYQRTMTGPNRPEVQGVRDLDRREVGTLAPLLLALVLFGFYPMPLLDVDQPDRRGHVRARRRDRRRAHRARGARLG